MVREVAGIAAIDWRIMNWELQLVALPVSDVDRAKDFPTDKRANEEARHESQPGVD